MNDFYILFPLIYVIAATALGFYVYERDTQNPRNYFFLSLMCVYVLASLFELKMVMAADDILRAKSFLYAQTLPLVFFPAVVFCFNNSFSGFVRFRNQWAYWAVIVPFMLVFLTLAKLLDCGAIKMTVISLKSSFIITPEFPAGLVCVLYFIVFLLAFLPFYSAFKFKRSQPEFYKEARLLFQAVFVPCVLFAAALYCCKRYLFGLSGGEIVYPFGLVPAACLLSTALLALAIVRYRSFNVSIIFNNALIYSVLTISISALYVVIQNFLENFFQGMFKSDNRIYGVLSALIIAFTFEPLNSRVSEFVKSLLDFFKVISQPSAAGDKNLEDSSRNDIKTLKFSYVIFIFFYLLIIVCAKFMPLAPRFAYLISGIALSLTGLYIVYNVIRLPFNMMAYSVMSCLFLSAHVFLITITDGVGVYVEAFGVLTSTMFLISAAAMIGRIIASRIDEIAFLIPLCLVAAVADLWSVFYGVTSELLTKKSVFLDYLLIRYPSLGSDRLLQFIGISDFLFAAIFMGCAFNFRLNLKKTYAGFVAAFIITFSLVVITRTGIPAIPVLAFVFMALNISVLKLKFEDVKTMLIVFLGSAAVFYIITSLRRMLNR